MPVAQKFTFAVDDLPSEVPWQRRGLTPHSRHASYLGAKDAEPRAHTQAERYVALLRAHPDGLCDYEAATLMQVERSTINARRVPLVVEGLVYSDGFRKGPTGIKNTIWKAR